MDLATIGMRPQRAWYVLVGGDIGPIGWCGQEGYWWTHPCGHPAFGCGWFDGEQVLDRETK